MWIDVFRVIFLEKEVIVRESGQMDFFCAFIEHLFELFDVSAFLGRDKHTVVRQTRHPHAFQFFKRHIFASPGCEVVFVLRRVSERVDFVEHHYHRFVSAVTHFAEGLVDNLDLLLEIRVGDVDHMYEQVCFAHLVECRFERVDEMGGKFADEPYGVG